MWCKSRSHRGFGPIGQGIWAYVVKNIENEQIIIKKFRSTDGHPKSPQDTKLFKIN